MILVWICRLFDTLTPGPTIVLVAFWEIYPSLQTNFKSRQHDCSLFPAL